jgi:hypothetical protein
MPRFVRVLVAVAIAAPLVASMPGPAVACDCARLDPHRIVRQADAIVAAHVINAFPIDPLHTRSTLAVDGVYKGGVGSSVTVISNVGASGGLDCAVLYPVGSSVDPLVLWRQPDQTYVVDDCSLAVLPQIVQLLGEPRPPPRGPPPTSPAPPVAAVAPPGAGVSWPAVGGGLLIAFALIVLAVRRLARESTAAPASAEAGDGSAVAAGGTEPPTESSD